MLKLCLHELIMRPFKRKSVIGPFPFGFTSILISSPPRSCGRLSSLATFGSQHRAASAQNNFYRCTVHERLLRESANEFQGCSN